MVDQWFPGKRKRFKARGSLDGEGGEPEGKILICHDPRLFGKRDKDGLILDEMSESMLMQACDLYDQVLVFCVECQACKDVKSLAESLGLSKVEVIFQPEDPLLRTEQMRKRIIQAGGRIKPAKNPREITYFNMERFVVSEHMVFAGREDWQKIGLELDKPQSFEDLHKERKKRSFW